MPETLGIKALAQRVYLRDIARDSALATAVSRPSHAPSLWAPRETPVGRETKSEGAPTSRAVTNGEWPSAEAAQLCVDTGLAIGDLERDWPASAWRRLY